MAINDPKQDGATSLTQAEALAEFRAAGALLEGHFLLSSGKHSAAYLQCARVMMDPRRGARLCGALAVELRARLPQGLLDSVDLCVSPAMGAVIVGYETARQLDLPSIFVERPDGAFVLRRGFEIPAGARCLMVEDVVTTGKSSRECIAAIQAAGGETVAAAALVDRTNGNVDLGAPFVALLTIDAPIFDPDMVPAELAAIPAIKPGSRRQNAANS
ncbi:MAG: orotate phosphoribosyltransferase [Neomegalonema sp.]|nr:orotate phosphoribosyltransferase [Neomegalonema sp.]